MPNSNETIAEHIGQYEYESNCADESTNRLETVLCDFCNFRSATKRRGDWPTKSSETFPEDKLACVLEALIDKVDGITKDISDLARKLIQLMNRDEIVEKENIALKYFIKWKNVKIEVLE